MSQTLITAPVRVEAAGNKPKRLLPLTGGRSGPDPYPSTPSPAVAGMMLSALACSSAPVHLVVAVSGELDMSSVPALSRELAAALLERPDSVTLDLAGVAFIDSSGLNLLVGTSKALRKHQGTLWLSSPRPPVRRLLEIVGLEAMLVA